MWIITILTVIKTIMKKTCGYSILDRLVYLCLLWFIYDDPYFC